MSDAPANARTRYARLFSAARPSERVEFFSDAVFAIAMTLLVLNIRLPDVEPSEVGAALRDLTPELFAYALSFIVIAAAWIGHHRRFEIIDGVDSGLIRLNLALLFVIAFLPFPTSVLSEYGSTVPAVVLYASTVTAMGLVQLATWMYVCRRGRLNVTVDRGAYRFGVLTIAVDPAVFALSIGIALLGWPEAAMYSWLLLIPVSALARRWQPGGADLTPVNG
ncbi:hypothetical protein ASE12_06870 [Aeromicrobium sp. Root236]|uniref:TMEM175 family protein n=1 Tax=Aeromicrobium sp. Root236 TaxID=1736498 RepID=UPI0006F78BDA|nr:TMEM175 family protein [Aeromicrobium sp. Root236]KRC64513.1 hypothetical protein ASE12_06870 [Aeromicrobium sp. Root236]